MENLTGIISQTIVGVASNVLQSDNTLFLLVFLFYVYFRAKKTVKHKYRDWYRNIFSKLNEKIDKSSQRVIETNKKDIEKAFSNSVARSKTHNKNNTKHIEKLILSNQEETTNRIDKIESWKEEVDKKLGNS